MQILILALLTLISSCVPFVPIIVYGAAAPDVPNNEWSFEGIRGDWDKAQMLRGYEVATQVCLACHSFKYVNHRNMMQIGFTEDEVKALAADLNMSIDEPIMSLLDDASAKEVYGKKVPEMSLLNRARPGGIDYTKALLLGYNDNKTEEQLKEYFPDGKVPAGAYFNKYYPGHAIAMPNPLGSDGMVEYRDGTEATVEQMAKDVAYFMQWMSEPEYIERKRLGIFVMLYIVIFAVLMYLWKNQIWKRVK